MELTVIYYIFLNTSHSPSRKRRRALVPNSAPSNQFAQCFRPQRAKTDTHITVTHSGNYRDDYTSHSPNLPKSSRNPSRYEELWFTPLYSIHRDPVTGSARPMTDTFTNITKTPFTPPRTINISISETLQKQITPARPYDPAGVT